MPISLSVFEASPEDEGARPKRAMVLPIRFSLDPRMNLQLLVRITADI